MFKKLNLTKEIDAGSDTETYNLDIAGPVSEFERDEADSLMSKSVINTNYLVKDEVPPYEVSMRQEKKQRRTEREKTKGKDWFNMSAGELNEEAKNDLTVIKMRGGLYKDQFFKKNDSDALPKYFEMGTIVDNPVDYYTTRVPKKQQKQTILEELIEDAKIKKFTKKHYALIQAKEERKRKILLRKMKRRKKTKK